MFKISSIRVTRTASHISKRRLNRDMFQTRVASFTRLFMSASAYEAVPVFSGCLPFSKIEFLKVKAQTHIVGHKPTVCKN